MNMLLVFIFPQNIIIFLLKWLMLEAAEEVNQVGTKFSYLGLLFARM